MLWLEARGVLDRDVEGLPQSIDMVARQTAGKPLTRPELSVLLAWSKITLFDDIVASDLPDDPFFTPVLESYFPAALGRYASSMQAHRLKREIIATVLANRLLDAGGPAFLLRMREAGSMDNAACVRAFEVARAALDMPGLHMQINDAGNKTNAAGRMALELALARNVSDAAIHIQKYHASGDISALVAQYKAGFETLNKGAVQRASVYDSNRYERRVKQLTKAGATAALAKDIEKTTLLVNTIEAIDIAVSEDISLAKAADIFCEIGGAFRIDRLRAGAQDAFAGMTQWESMAAYGQLASLLSGQADATRQVLAGKGDVGAYLKARSGPIDGLNRQLRAMSLGRDWSFAKFALATDAVKAALI
jgi:glutamate dehydrogenase